MRTDVRSPYDSSAIASTVTGRVVALAEGLRDAGVPVSTGETIDAVRALAVVDLASRPVVRSALHTTLVKDDGQDEVFDRLFDLLFPRPSGPPAGTPPPGPGNGAAGSAAAGPDPGRDVAGATQDLEAVRDALADALRRGDAEGLAGLLADSVDRWSGIGDQDRSERHHVQRVLRRLGLDQVLRSLLRGEGERDDLDRRIDASEAAAMLAEVRRLVERLVAERVRQARGGDPTGDRSEDEPGSRPPGPDGLEDLAILRAGPDELAALRAAVRPLARRLATRLGRRRRRGHGGLDMRRTLRASMSSGGVPLSPALRQRSPSKPDLVVLCDVSGSVAQFAPFTLALLHALHAEFRRVRSWVFIDGVVEITDLLQRAPGVLDAPHLLGRHGLVAGDGRSDYARALRAYLTGWPDTVTPKTTVLVVGDARSHDRTPAVAEIAELHRQSRKLYWLNPEPAAEWDTDDSLMALYRAHCHGAYEVSTLRQLGECVAGIA